MWEAVFGFVLSGPGAFVGALSLGGVCWLGWWWRTRSRRPGEPEVVTGWLPFVGCALDYGKNAGVFLRRCQKRHGDHFTLYLAGRRSTFLLDPRDYPMVFHEHRDALTFHDVAEQISSKAFGHPMFDEMKGDYGFLSSMTKERLKGKDLATLTTSMQQNLETFLSEHGSSSQEDWHACHLYDFVYEAMFVAGTHTVFGRGFHSRETMEAFRALDDKFPLLIAGVPHRFARTHRDLDFLIERCGTAFPEASQLMQERRDYMDEEMEPRPAGALQVGMLWAAQANTIPATFWSLAYILRHPDAHEALLQELRDVGAIDKGTGESVALTRALLMKMTKLDSAISEALRLSSASMVIRRVTQDVSLSLASGESVALREGAELALYPYLTHRDPEVFQAPDTYQWDRFLADEKPPAFEKYGQRLKYPLVPFGGGVSLCPGRHFARNEIKLFVALMLAQYEMTLEQPDVALPPLEQARAGLGILPPIHDLSFRLRKRSS